MGKDFRGVVKPGLFNPVKGASFENGSPDERAIVDRLVSADMRLLGAHTLLVEWHRHMTKAECLGTWNTIRDYALRVFCAKSFVSGLPDGDLKQHLNAILDGRFIAASGGRAPGAR